MATSTQEIRSSRAPYTGYVNPFVDWLLNDGWNITDPKELVARLAERMVAEGIPLWRMRINIRTLHPLVFGTAYTWRRDADHVEEFNPPHSILDTAQYLDSPFAAIFDGAGGIRRRLDVPGVEIDFPILKELHAEGATDYVAMPILFHDGKINAITFATDRPGGFATAELETMFEMLPVLARQFEVYAMHRTARNLLDTYLGKYTGERVLNGHIKLGDGEDIQAVIWFCDLRDSTVMADSMERRDFLAILNDFFDCMAGAVLEHGGEVLRFIGDAALAIFPTGVSTPSRQCCSAARGCEKALEAARDAYRRMEDLNRSRASRDLQPLRFGLALHEGEVMYGNIGVPERLEFTVIGAAANEAARLESLCKTLDKPILISARFESCFPGKLVSLGHHPLRGVSDPQEVFTLPEFG